MKNPSENNFTIRKIPLKIMLLLLTDLYEGGADFIDIHAKLDENKIQDNITISVPMEYMNEDSKKSLEMKEEDIPPPPLDKEGSFLFENFEGGNKKLTENDIKLLLSNV